MKKRAYVWLLTVLFIFMTGCGDKKEEKVVKRSGGSVAEAASGEQSSVFSSAQGKVGKNLSVVDREAILAISSQGNDSDETAEASGGGKNATSGTAVSPSETAASDVAEEPAEEETSETAEKPKETGTTETAEAPKETGTTETTEAPKETGTTEAAEAPKETATSETEPSTPAQPSHTHSYFSTITKNPTCTAKGEKTYTCSCGDSYTEEIPATGHEYGVSTVTTMPTCEAPGVRTTRCIHCQKEVTETIPATGHEYFMGRCTKCNATQP